MKTVIRVKDWITRSYNYHTILLDRTINHTILTSCMTEKCWMIIFKFAYDYSKCIVRSLYDCWTTISTTMFYVVIEFFSIFKVKFKSPKLKSYIYVTYWVALFILLLNVSTVTLSLFMGKSSFIHEIQGLVAIMTWDRNTWLKAHVHQSDHIIVGSANVHFNDFGTIIVEPKYDHLKMLWFSKLWFPNDHRTIIFRQF